MRVFRPLLLLLPGVFCSVAPVWKTPITERRFAPNVKRSSAPYYSRPEDFKIPNYVPPHNNGQGPPPPPLPPPRIPITPPGYRPNYNVYPQNFRGPPVSSRFDPPRPSYPQAYQQRVQGPPRYPNGWIYWNGEIVPPEALQYLHGVGPIPPQGAYGPGPSAQPPVSPGIRPDTFTGTVPMSPSASPTEAYNTGGTSPVFQQPTPPPTLPTTGTTPEEDYTSASLTPEEATMGSLFTANKNPYSTPSDNGYGRQEKEEAPSTLRTERPTTSETTTARIYEETTTRQKPTETSAESEYFPRPVPSQSYQPGKGPEIVEKLNVNILHPGGPCTGPLCFDKNQVSVYTPPKGPKFLISNAAKGQASLLRPSVPEHKFLPYAPNLGTSARPIEPPHGGPRVFMPPDEFSVPPYDQPTPPPSPQEPYFPTARTYPPESPYEPSPPSAPPPSPPSYTPHEEDITPVVPDYNRGPASTFPPPAFEVPPSRFTEAPNTTPRLPPWATETPSEGTFSPTFRPMFPVTTPEAPTPPSPTGFVPRRPQEGPNPPPRFTPGIPSVPTPPTLAPTPVTREQSPPPTPPSRIPPSPGLPQQTPSPRIPSVPSETPGIPPSRSTLPGTPPPSSRIPPETPPSRTPFTPGIPPSGDTPRTPPTPPQQERTPGIPPAPPRSPSPGSTNPPRTTPNIPSSPLERPSFPSFPPETPQSPPKQTTPSFTPETSTTPSFYSTTPKKGVQNRLRTGKVRVICQDDGIKFVATSILPFTGEIFANDRKRVPVCFHTFQKALVPMAFLPFEECGVRNNAEQPNNQTQYHMQIVVVVKQEDGSTTVQSYMAQCVHQKIQYNKQSLPRRIEEALEELKLVPIKLEQKALLPLIEMKLMVDEHGRMGPEVAAVDIGMPLALHWKLTNESAAYGFHVKNCTVADTIIGAEMMLIDEQGCSTDTTILGHPHYDTYHDTASSHMWAFKVPDHSKLRLTCEVSICTDIMPTGSNSTSCSSIPTPPFCSDLITSPTNSILLDGSRNFLKRRREIDATEETQTVRAAICTSEDCRRDYVALPHCVDPRWLAASSAFSASLFLLSVLVNLGLRCKVSHEKWHAQNRSF